MLVADLTRELPLKLAGGAQGLQREVQLRGVVEQVFFEQSFQDRAQPAGLGRCALRQRYLLP